MIEPLSREFLKERGKCCHKGCVNCPYEHNGSMRSCPHCIKHEEEESK